MLLNMFQGYFQGHYFCKLTRASSPFTGGSFSHGGIPSSSSPPPDPSCNFIRSICKQTPLFVFSTLFIICWCFNSLRNVVSSHYWFTGYGLIISDNPSLELELGHAYWVKASTHLPCSTSCSSTIGFESLNKKFRTDSLGYNHSGTLQWHAECPAAWTSCSTEM